MFDWFIYALERYQDFEGRSRRTEFWMFTASQFVIMLTLMVFAGILQLFLGTIVFLPIFLFIASVVLFVPGLAVTVRRLHDTGKSGWWMLISLIPFGSVLLLYFLVKEGDPGENEYGYDPKDELELEEDWREEEIEYDYLEPDEDDFLEG